MTTNKDISKAKAAMETERTSHADSCGHQHEHTQLGFPSSSCTCLLFALLQIPIWPFYIDIQLILELTICLSSYYLIERGRGERRCLLFDGKFPCLITLFLVTKRPWLLQKQIQKPDSIFCQDYQPNGSQSVTS